MTLEAKLASIREASAKRMPAPARATMHAHTDALRASGASERALGAGSMWPAFELPAADGTRVRSADLLARGPLVVSFFRGHW